ncbi:acetyl-CoA acetyltransferase [Gordonia sp. NPDC058843]|uniref:acetyl-CoA acetyltransferase n=1 Tax=Gordonia sp. NPDC058843 TaxID=3346648 RepID=UPI00369F1996
MTIDPRTPVLVGGGQVTARDGGVEPFELLARAAREAAAEAGSSRILELVDSIRVVGLLSWRYRDPGALVAERIGAHPRHTGYTGNGGSTPQVLVNGAAEDIAAGRADVILIGGAEAWRTRMKLRAQGERPAWTRQDDAVPSAPIIVPDVPMEADSERRIGLDRPSFVYPLFEQALRIAAGRSIADHEKLLGELWSSFSAVAADNPHAWTRRQYAPEEITTPTDVNRLISSPYPKLLNSNNMVDQGAALLMCSVETAQHLGVPASSWVFPHSGTESRDTDAVAARPALDGSAPIRIGAARALELAGVGIADIEHLDIYSCFPSAVQVAAAEIGVPIDDPDRRLTCTGGLTFAGGPWNNYSTHAIAAVATRLREAPGTFGMVTANSGYLTKHAFGVYSTDPPAAGFRRHDVTEAVERAWVDAEPPVGVIDSHEGVAELETWTVAYDRAGSPERAFVAGRVRGGGRTLAVVTDPDDLGVLASTEAQGRRVRIAADGSAHLD